MLVDFWLKFQVKLKEGVFYPIHYFHSLEHTWGLPSVYDDINWSNIAFEKVVNSIQSYRNCVIAWTEQREFFDIYLETVHTHPLYDIIQDELYQAFNNVTRPNTDNFKIVSPSETFVLFSESPNPIRVAFDENLGSISKLSRSDTIYWTDKNSQLGSYIYITYNETDFTELAHTYMTAGTIYIEDFRLYISWLFFF